MTIGLVPLPTRARERVRDIFSDQLTNKTQDQIVKEMVDSLRDWASTSDPFLKRRKWCLSKLHTRADQERMVRAAIAGIGVPGGRDQADAIYGTDLYEAELFDAWFGVVGFRDTEGGTGWGGADDIDWGEQLGDESFDDVAAALEFSDQLTKDGIDNTGVYLGADGKWHVTYDPNGSD